VGGAPIASAKAERRALIADRALRLSVSSTPLSGPISIHICIYIYLSISIYTHKHVDSAPIASAKAERRALIADRASRLSVSSTPLSGPISIHICIYIYLSISIYTGVNLRTHRLCQGRAARVNRRSRVALIRQQHTAVGHTHTHVFKTYPSPRPGPSGAR